MIKMQFNKIKCAEFNRRNSRNNFIYQDKSLNGSLEHMT